MSAGDIPIGDFSYAVNSDLSSYQFYAVYLASTGYLVLATTAYPTMGILQDNPNGATKVTVGSVRELGHTKAWVDTSTIVAGSPLKVSSTAGMLGLGSLGSDVIVGVACEANSSTSCVIEVALTNRTAQGVTSRAGQLHFSFPISAMRTTGNMLAAVPLGFSGTITGAFAICETVASTSESSATASITVGVDGASSVTGLAIAMTASSVVLGTVTAGTGTVGGTYTFGPTDTLYITVTQGGTQFSASDTGRVGIYVTYI